MSQRLSPLTLSRLFLVPAFFGASVYGEAAFAADPTPALQTAQLCSQRFSHAENSNGIPKQLLAAISATESGRWSDQAKTVVPWPWTINAGGQGYYFDSMNEAIGFANRLRAKGIDSFDVGCMQVNLHHHPDAFASLNDAFDPEKNIAYGAKFLRNNYDDLKSWPEAIAAYHSRTPEVGNPYYVNVRRNWQRVLQGGEFALANAMPYPATMGGRAVSYVAGVAINRGLTGASTPSAAAQPQSRRDSTFQISVKDESGLHAIDESRRGRPLNKHMPAGVAMASAGPEASASRVIHIGDKGSAKSSESAPSAGSPEVLVIRSNGSAVKSSLSSGQSSRNVTLASIGEDNGGGTFVTGHAVAAKHAPESLVATSQAGGSAPDAEVKRVSSRKAGPNFIFD